MTVFDPAGHHSPEDFEDHTDTGPTLHGEVGNEIVQACRDLVAEYNLPHTVSPGFDTPSSSYQWYKGSPEGAMVHHTATSSYGPERAAPPPGGTRTDGKTICNILIQPDGRIDFITSGPANYSSGLNQKALLDDYVSKGIRFHGPQSGPLGPDWYGNRCWANIEVVHLGDSSVMPAAQEQALIYVCAILVLLMKRNGTAVVGHLDGRGTKIDPRWDGPYSTPPYTIAGIQDAVTELIDNDNPPGGDMDYRGVSNVPDQDWARGVIDWGIDNRIIITDDDHQDDWDKNVDYGRLWTLLKRMDSTFH